MNNNPHQPHPDDVVLGGESRPPASAVVLGGLGGIKWRLKSHSEEVRTAAVSQALKYGEKGLKFLFDTIGKETGLLTWEAYNFLWERLNKEGKEKLQQYSFKAVLPELIEKGMVRRLGSGIITNLLFLSNESIVLCTTDGAALWNIRTGKALWEIDCPANYSAISRDRTLLALSGYQGIYLWDLRTGKLLPPLQGQTCLTTSIAFCPNRNLLASGSHDSTVRLWDITSRTLVREFWGYNSIVYKGNPIAYTVAFSPDGKLLIWGHRDKTSQLWDVASGELVREFGEHHNYVRGVAFSPDGKLLASASGVVQLWDVASGALVRRLLMEDGWDMNGVKNVAFSQDGKLLISGNGYTVQLWDVASGELVQKFSGGYYIPDTRISAKSVAFSPDEKLIASGTWHSTLQLWDIASGQAVRQFDGHTHIVNSVTFSCDGKLLASGSRGSLRLWDVASGEVVWHVRDNAYGDRVDSIAFSPDGKLLASAMGEMVTLWNVASGEQVGFGIQSKSDLGMGVAFSPDGKLLASASCSVQLWDVASDELVLKSKFDRYGANSVIFSPDGKLLASMFYGDIIRLRDVASGKLVAEFDKLNTQGSFGEHHARRSQIASFSSDGKLLAFGLQNNVIQWRDVASGELVRQLDVHGYDVNCFAFSPDGKLWASGNLSGVVRLWKVD